MAANTHKKPRRDRRQRMVALLAALLALLMILPMVIMVVSNLTVGAASVSDIQSQLKNLKGKNQALEGKKTSLQSELSGLQADKNAAINKKNNLEQQIGVLQEEIANLDAQLEQYAILITEKEREVAENEAQEEAQFDLFCRQVRAMEKGGTASYLSILFSADSFADLLDRVNTVNSIEDYNDLVCRQLQAAREALRKSKEDLEAAQAETQAAKVQQEAAKEELAEQERQVEGLIQEIVSDEAQTQAALDQLEADSAAMDAEIAKKEKELQAAIAEAKRKAEEEARRQQAAGQSGGQSQNAYQFDPGSGFYWPLPSNRVNITSFFGYRKDPFTGKSANHSGTDIGSPAGTPIYAAHGGIILTSAYHRSYGNYVVVSRGDGITTLYAHMSQRAVAVGETVSQGQTIGYVGSTGRSTAPHLHYEVRLNGVRQDALQYYPNLNWVNHTGYSYR